ncbi:MAG: sensor histidine kinase [Cytophagaceae bacterium]|nr:sensor histidine kinase [Cytophagaceae bacterium]MBK9935213.1 sensor histidine kinase [Cytophagaceae bacterium]MBL0301656.1 sensor histidine kinase [Cytophagaceae bacterium]MBL0324481.1 sensor histidine kinase [Cytophagaceae bacterium]
MKGEYYSELFVTVVAIILIVILLVIFIISFFFVHQNRLQKHKLEKAALQAQFEQEILNAENEIQDSTMKHISRELHDNVGQMLTLVKIQLNNLTEEIPNNKKISDARSFVANVLTDIRALSKSLNSDNLLQEGLVSAINFELERVKYLGIYNLEFNFDKGETAINPKNEILIFRIFQELLQNCLKHAQAKNITVNLVESPQCLNLEVVDDGIGFDFQTKIQQSGYKSGAGLSNLIHRAHLMNGTLSFEKGIPKGTRAHLTIPF